MPISRRKPISRRTRGGVIGGNMLGNFTNSDQIKNKFLAHTSIRQAQKVSNDGTYWTGGQCQWGGSHNLLQDCQILADFANSTAKISDDIQEMILSVDEQQFNNRKQQLVSKLQENISKCNITQSTSLGGICIIWNDFFGSFIKGFLEGFRQKLQSQLTQLQSVEPAHQRDILQIEAKIKEAESKYQENFAKAEKETDPSKKAKFMVLANEALDEVNKLRQDYKRNPIAQLNRYDYLNDLQRLFDGNLGGEPPTQSSHVNLPNANSVPAGGSPNNGNQPPSNPFLGSETNSDNQPNNQQQLLILAVLGIAIVFLIFNKEKEETY